MTGLVTDWEMEVLQLIVDGIRTDGEIAAELGISELTEEGMWRRSSTGWG